MSENLKTICPNCGKKVKAVLDEKGRIVVNCCPCCKARSVRTIKNPQKMLLKVTLAAPPKEFKATAVKVYYRDMLGQ